MGLGSQPRSTGSPTRATPAAGRRRSLNLDSTVPTLTATCPRNRAAQPPKPIRCNITTTGPPLIWTAVVYDRRSFLLIISALIERRHSKLRHYRREEGRDRCLGGGQGAASLPLTLRR